MGEPDHLLAGEKAQRQRDFLRLIRSPCAVGCGLDLRQRQPRMIEENSSRGGEHDTTRLALQQSCANLFFEIANLPAQRWLRGVQAALGSSQEAALLCNGHKEAQMP